MSRFRSAGSADGPPRVEAIDRALELLIELAGAGASGRSLTDLCAATGISKATAYRALSTLRGRGFVSQSAQGDYQLGRQSLALGDQYFAGDNLIAALNPSLVELSRRSEELVHLGTWDGDQVVYLDKVEPARRAIRVWSSVGQRVPAASSALGRALMGAGGTSEAQLAHYIATLPADRHVTLERLQDAVAEVRSTGFSSETEENEPGVACLGTAVMRGSQPVAAISITSLASRMTDSHRERLRGLIREILPPLLPDGLRLYPGP